MSLNSAISNENVLSPKLSSKHTVKQYHTSSSLNSAINGTFPTPTLSHSNSFSNIVADAIKNVQIPQIPITPIGSPPPLSVANIIPLQTQSNIKHPTLIGNSTDLDLISADLSITQSFNALGIDPTPPILSPRSSSKSGNNGIQNQQQTASSYTNYNMPPHPIMLGIPNALQSTPIYPSPNTSQQCNPFYQQQQMQQMQQMQNFHQMQQFQQMQQYQQMQAMKNRLYNDNDKKHNGRKSKGNSKGNRKKYVRNMDLNNFDRGKKTLNFKEIKKCVLDKKIVDMIQTQEGSRFIQKCYTELSRIEKSELLSQVLEDDIVELSKHVFANWVTQLIYQYATFEECKEIIKALKGKVLELSLNGFGCRLIQKIISTSNKTKDIEDDIKLKEEILVELHGNTIECLRNNNGHHVIEKILSNCRPSLSTFILKEIIPQLMALAVDPFGCQIIELILQKFSFENKEIKELMIRITSNIAKMSKHKFGNYIIQDVIESAPLDTQDKMFKAIFLDIVILGKNKYSSNVVEKSIYLCSSKRRRKLVRRIVNELQSLKNDKNQSITASMLYQLIYDKFGNYVIQTLMLCSGRKDREKLIEAINETCPNLTDTPYGKHIKSAIAKVMRQNAQ